MTFTIFFADGGHLIADRPTMLKIEASLVANRVEFLTIIDEATNEEFTIRLSSITRYQSAR